jgi:hypothetical protein
MQRTCPHRRLLPVLVLAAMIAAPAGNAPAAAPDGWIDLFDGRSMDGWQAAENPDTWRVADGCLVGEGPRSHLFYTGPVADHAFRNFDLVADVRTGPGANSGVFFHTAWQEKGWLTNGYEVQINNTHSGSDDYRELKLTGSLYAVRNIYAACARDGEWFRLRVRVVGKRIRVWVNDYPTVDYVEPADPPRPKRPGRVLSRGTFALQGHDPGSRVAFRSIRVRPLPPGADPNAEPRASTAGYGVTPEAMDRLGLAFVPVIDYHVHLRGGMTVEKAMARQAVTGVNLGVLKNIGTGWPIEADAQLKAFLDSVDGRPVFVGLQVNDRDWMTKHARHLLGRLDYVLADTMIMPMPDDDSPPVKLWQADKYTITDPEAWMKRYVQHNLRVLGEPITILANPTWLPPPVKDKYDALWTEARMRKVIRAAVENGVALEINARSGYPRERFIRLAKKMGATFSFGTNNFNDKPIDMSRCLESVKRYGLTKDDMYVPAPKP